MNDIVRAGIIMTVYLAVLIMVFIFISSPFETLVTSFDDINGTASDDKVEKQGETSRTIFNMIFAGLALVPSIYFVIWVFSREPDWRYRQ